MRTIRFFSNVDGVAEAFPIIPAEEYKPAWITAARDEYVQVKKQSEGEKFNHVYRCPGIFDLMSTGYIVPMPWDVMVETKGDGEDFKWSVPTNIIPDFYGGPPVAGHMARGLAKVIPKPPGVLKSIVKFHTPWHIISPPDVKFLIIPLPYPDSFVFQHNIGLLDPGYSTEINPQGWWSILDGQHLLKAGTPMCQLVPLTNETFKMEVGTATEKELAWMKKRQYFFGLSFAFKRNLSKAMYLKHFFNR